LRFFDDHLNIPKKLFLWLREKLQAIKVTNLGKFYGTFEALKGISFTVKEGEIFGLIGPNGSGKTTTLRILATILKPSYGDVRVFGLNIVKEANKVRELISYLPEEADLYRRLTGYENLMFLQECTLLRKRK